MAAITTNLPSNLQTYDAFVAAAADVLKFARLDPLKHPDKVRFLYQTLRDKVDQVPVQNRADFQRALDYEQTKTNFKAAHKLALRLNFDNLYHALYERPVFPPKPMAASLKAIPQGTVHNLTVQYPFPKPKRTSRKLVPASTIQHPPQDPLALPRTMRSFDSFMQVAGPIIQPATQGKEFLERTVYDNLLRMLTTFYKYNPDKQPLQNAKQFKDVVDIGYDDFYDIDMDALYNALYADNNNRLFITKAEFSDVLNKYNWKDVCTRAGVVNVDKLYNLLVQEGMLNSAVLPPSRRRNSQRWHMQGGTCSCAKWVGGGATKRSNSKRMRGGSLIGGVGEYLGGVPVGGSLLFQPNAGFSPATSGGSECTGSTCFT